MKTLIIISTGRCGTKRTSELLSNALDPTKVIVTHQKPLSRISNVIGNIMYYTGSVEWVKKILFPFNTGKRHRIICDPLVSMCVPEELANNEQTFILHVKRDCSSFSESMFALSRKRIFSFIAHNFIPYWQIGLWPLENILNPKIKAKYADICRNKNDWFSKQFSQTQNYLEISMQELFEPDFLNRLVFKIFEKDIHLSEETLKQKSNQSR